jgi:hypothetical protein
MKYGVAFLVLFGVMLFSDNSSAQCLARDNERYDALVQGAVYTNGKLKFRIDWWHIARRQQVPNHPTAQELDRLFAEAPDKSSISVRSTAPGFNGTIEFNGTSFSMRDTSLCPGTEITVACRYKYFEETGNSYWDCQFSQF